MYSDLYLSACMSNLSTAPKNIMQIAGVHWHQESRGHTRAYSRSMTNGLYPALIMFRFGESGVGNICLLDPCMLSVLSCMLYIADHAEPIGRTT